MEFINSVPSQTDLKNPRSIILYFLRTSETYKTKYKNGWTLHAGASRSWIECVEYCSKFFTKARIERALVLLLESASIYCFRCSDINREVIVFTDDGEVFNDHYYNQVCIGGYYKVSSDFAKKLVKISGDNGYISD